MLDARDTMALVFTASIPQIAPSDPARTIAGDIPIVVPNVRVVPDLPTSTTFIVTVTDHAGHVSTAITSAAVSITE